ncbi:MAG TPA: CZB domain-containing protein [Gallionellaceae bacterium]
MGLLEWWHHEQNRPMDPAPLTGAIAQSPIKGLNISEAVSAHTAWKERLFHYVNGTSTEKLDENMVCRDDACALGKWIYGDAHNFLSEIPDFHRLKASHAAFHIAAGDVVRAVNSDQRKKAEKLLVDGPFSEHSREVQLMLAKLYVKLDSEE